MQSRPLVSRATQVGTRLPTQDIYSARLGRTAVGGVCIAGSVSVNMAWHLFGSARLVLPIIAGVVIVALVAYLVTRVGARISARAPGAFAQTPTAARVLLARSFAERLELASAMIFVFGVALLAGLTASILLYRGRVDQRWGACLAAAAFSGASAVMARRETSELEQPQRLGRFVVIFCLWGVREGAPAFALVLLPLLSITHSILRSERKKLVRALPFASLNDVDFNELACIARGLASQRVRCKALEVLAQSFDRERLNPLLERLIDSAPTRVRARASEIWVRMNPSARLVRIQGLLEGATREFATSVTKMIAERGDREAERVLLALLQHRATSVRWACAHALGNMGSSRCIEPLLAVPRFPGLSLDLAVRSAVLKIKRRVYVNAEPGQLSMIERDRGGALSVAREHGALSVAPARTLKSGES